VTDLGLPNLEAVSGLEYLNLSNTAVTDAGVKRLKKALPKLKVDR
jgi:hypothetical protein